MSYFKRVQLDDGTDPISVTTGSNGDKYLEVAMIQDVHIDTNNSSTANLSSGSTFTGTATATLGVAGLQVSLKTDQNCTVYVDQSPDATNWDITDSFTYYYSKGGNGWTIQAVNSYVRVRVTNNGASATTYFRLQLALCPSVEALPRSLDNYGHLQVTAHLQDIETGKNGEVDAVGSLKTTIVTRLVGTQFSGTTKDTNFWTETVTGSGAVTKAGQITLSTGTTANSTVQYNSVRRGRKVPGTVNQFRAVARLTTDPQANNIRRFGAYDDNDGLFFQINGTTFGVGSRKGTVDTIVNSGSFNGNYGASVTMDTALKRLVINYTAFSAQFFVNDILLHSIVASTAPSCNTLTLPIRMENNNSGGNTTDNAFEVRFATVVRLGELQTAGVARYIGTNTTTILKYDAGTLQSIINNDNAGTVTIYDNTAATGTQIAVVDAAKALGTLNFNAPFSVGLTIVTAGGAKITVVYE